LSFYFIFYDSLVNQWSQITLHSDSFRGLY